MITLNSSYAFPSDTRTPQLGKPREAARACAQYFYYNPHNQATKSKLRLYRQLRQVTDDDLKPTQTFKYVSKIESIFLEDHNGFLKGKEIVFVNITLLACYIVQ